METIKIEIEVNKELDPWSLLCWITKDRYVDKAFCYNGVLTIYILKDLTSEAIFELGFNAGLKFSKQ